MSNSRFFLILELYGCGGSHYEGVSPDAVLPLDRPLAYKFSGLTKRALLYHSSGFERWGIHYQFTRTTPTNVDIQVNKIPRAFEDESIGSDVRTTIKVGAGKGAHCRHPTDRSFRG